MFLGRLGWSLGCSLKLEPILCLCLIDQKDVREYHTWNYFWEQMDWDIVLDFSLGSISLSYFLYELHPSEQNPKLCRALLICRARYSALKLSCMGTFILYHCVQLSAEEFDRVCAPGTRGSGACAVVACQSLLHKSPPKQDQVGEKQNLPTWDVEESRPNHLRPRSGCTTQKESDRSHVWLPLPHQGLQNPSHASYAVPLTSQSENSLLPQWYSCWWNHQKGDLTQYKAFAV